MTTDSQEQLLPVLEDVHGEGIGPILYENESLDTLLSTLPKTLGLLKNQLTYTCFDVSKDYFAAGTNQGLVCMYSFQSQNMQFIQNRSDPITYILIDSYRKCVAIGDRQGAVSMFNFNKEMLFATQEKSHNPVSCLAWGKEYNILFSGYSSGKIIVSHFQSDKNSLYSKVLMESGPALFQMSYLRGLLLVSNQQRSFLLRVGDDLVPGPIINIGSKDRKQGMYGATFFQNENKETKIAVARPGFRIWFVSMEGLVESTGKLKDHLFVPGAPPISFMGRTQPSLIPSTDLQFTYLMPFQGRYLISWCQNHLWVIDPIELRVLGQTSGLRSVRWTVGDEGDMYIFHDGYQIFRKVSLHTDYLVVEPTLPPANLSTAVAEGEVLQEVNCQLSLSDDKQMDLFPIQATEADIRSSPTQGLKGVKTDKSSMSEIQNRLKEKLLINDDILQKTKHFFKESVGPILEKTSTSFLRPSTPTCSTPTKDTDANTSNDSTADNEPTAQLEEPENQDDQPLAFASKAEQLRRLGTIQLMDSDELVVKTIRKKKRHLKKARGPSRASSMNSLITDTTSDLSEQPELDLITQLEGEAEQNSSLTNENTRTADEYKPPDDVVVAKDRQIKEDILKLRDSQMEEAGEVKFAFTFISESSRAIQMRKTVNSEEISDNKSEKDLASSHSSQEAIIQPSTLQIEDTTPTLDNIAATGDHTADAAIKDTVVLGTADYLENSTQLTELISPIKQRDSHVGSENIDSFTEIDMKDVTSPELSHLDQANEDPGAPVEKCIDFQLSEDYFSRVKILSPEQHELDSYDIISDDVEMRDHGLSNGGLLDSEDTLNPQYAEKLSRIISRRSRAFSYAPNEVPKFVSGVDNSLDSNSLNSHDEMVASVTMEEELQPSTTRPISGNNWSSYRLKFTQSTRSLSVSDRAIWIVEEGRGNVYWCRSAQLNWQRIPGVSAEQVSTSYNGHVVLVVSRDNQLFLRRGINNTNFAGKSWHKLHDGITYISCGPTTFWAISFTGDVLFSNHSDPVTFKTIPSVVRYKQIDSSDSVTVALGMDNIVYLRTGITADNMCGDAWRSVTLFEVANVSICLTTVWAISTDGKVYFNPELRNTRTNSTRTALESDQAWFQVMLRTEQLREKGRSSSYMPRIPLMFTHTAHSMFWPSISRVPGSSKLSYVLPTCSLAVDYECNHLISSSILGGVWVLSGSGTQKLYHCNSHIIGVKYLPILEQEEMGSPFVSVSAGYASGDQGVRSDHIWALKANGGLVSFDLNRKRYSIAPDRSMELKSVTVCEDCLWCCDLENRCWVRSQITSNTPLGAKWIAPDMGNLVGEPIQGISCGLLSIWAVTTKGEVWLRFGNSPTLHTFEKTLSPVWLRLSSDSNDPSVLMKQVIVGPGDWKVWAISMDNQVYIRKGITRFFPIGDKWELIPDMLAIELALSVYHVWVLDPTGNLHLRLGVSQMNPAGNYWKPVLGKNLKKITVTPYGQLWCIDDKGELFCRLEKNYLENDLVSSCVSIVNNPQVSDWEVL